MLCPKTLGTSIFVDITFICTHLGNSAPQWLLPSRALCHAAWQKLLSDRVKGVPMAPRVSAILSSIHEMNQNKFDPKTTKKSELFGEMRRIFAALGCFNVVADWCILDGLLRRHVSLSL